MTITTTAENKKERGTEQARSSLRKALLVEKRRSSLVDSERAYLETLLKECDDADQMNRASRLLSDGNLFPEATPNNNSNASRSPTTTTTTTTSHEHNKRVSSGSFRSGSSGNLSSSSSTKHKRNIQSQLFRAHEQSRGVRPSVMLRRLKTHHPEQSRSPSILYRQTVTRVMDQASDKRRSRSAPDRVHEEATINASKQHVFLVPANPPQEEGEECKEKDPQNLIYQKQKDDQQQEIQDNHYVRRASRMSQGFEVQQLSTTSHNETKEDGQPPLSTALRRKRFQEEAASAAAIENGFPDKIEPSDANVNDDATIGEDGDDDDDDDDEPDPWEVLTHIPWEEEDVAFDILGTHADDESCQPHVMTPPLLESLQAFLPESISETNFWLKYSLIRDGPGLLQLYRHVRGSNRTILAIETTDGQVFGSYTSLPWHIREGYWYGSKESFLWKMRQSRLTPCETIMEQAMLETELEVFLYTGANDSVQLCSRDMLALGVASDKSVQRKYPHALFLNPSLRYGSTTASRTFGNACLTDGTSKGETFEVANIEVWTMTPCTTVQEAEQEEMSRFFFEAERTRDRDLNFVGLLVGSY